MKAREVPAFDAQNADALAFLTAADRMQATALARPESPGDATSAYHRAQGDAMKATVDEAGHLVLPKEVLEAAGLRPGMSLDVRYDGVRIEIEPEPSIRLVRRGRFLVAVSEEPGTAPPDIIEQTREAVLRERFPYVD